LGSAQKAGENARGTLAQDLREKLQEDRQLFRVASQLKRRHCFRLCIWVGIAVVMMVVNGCLVVTHARGRSETKVAAKRTAPPYWAFAVDPGAGGMSAPEETTDRTTLHVPGSAAAFTYVQLHDFYNVPDWHPDGHPEMPEAVARGRNPEVYACGYCHLPNGLGRPENSSLAGLPMAYIVQQLADFKSGARKSSEPRLKPVSYMIGVAAKANEKEVRVAARYFSGLQLKPWIRVVETRTVPKTHVSGWMLVSTKGGPREAIGQRIIEMPEDLERTELRDDASGFVAYVPAGSVKRGQMLVTRGEAGKTMGCALCHGMGLKGMGNAPGIVGRSPSYVVRQLFDMQSGARAGAGSRLMKPAVEKLTVEDMVAIAAYLGSVRP
jgi:cytochrome c553